MEGNSDIGRERRERESKTDKETEGKKRGIEGERGQEEGIEGERGQAEGIEGERGQEKKSGEKRDETPQV